jgi:membrane protein DedA with SNARE-associated domain
MLSAIGVLPPQHELLDRLKDVLLTGSLIWLFIICAIESTVAVNLYFPGALVILATMAAAEGHPGLIAKVFFTITSGQIFGYLLDYAIGYRFKHLLESVQLQPWRPSWQINAPFLRLELLMKPELMILLTYGHPHSAALTSYSLGAEQGLSAGRFAIWALIGVFVWGGIWTFICLNGGNTLIRNTPWGPVFFGFIFFWFAWIAVRYYRQGQR